MIDRAGALALSFEPADLLVSRGRLQLFAGVVDEPNPIHSQVDAARRAGHRDLVVPPTYFFSMELETHGLVYVERLGISISSILHGEQAFDYHALCYASDVVTIAPRVVDYYEKRGGTMAFVVKETRFTRAGQDLATARSTIISVNQPAA